MQIYKKINPIRVISFDLDDTLYNNHPIINAAVKAQLDYLNELTLWQQQPTNFWMQCRDTVANLQPEIVDDVTAWRQQTLRFALQKIGYSPQDVEHHAVNAYQAFADARSQIVVDEQVLSLLNQLKQQYKVVAITNGNVDVERFNLKGMFDLVLMAGRDGKAKPHADLFNQAAQHFDVPLNSILHVGDSLDTDVQGANNSGCMSVWLDNQAISYQYKGLAHIAITDVLALKVIV